MAPITFSFPLCLSMMQTTEAWNVVRLSLKHLLDPMASDLLSVDLTPLDASNAHGLKSHIELGSLKLLYVPFIVIWNTFSLSPITLTLKYLLYSLLLYSIFSKVSCFKFGLQVLFLSPFLFHLLLFPFSSPNPYVFPLFCLPLPLLPWLPPPTVPFPFLLFLLLPAPLSYYYSILQPYSHPAVPPPSHPPFLHASSQVFFPSSSPCLPHFPFLP